MSDSRPKEAYRNYRRAQKALDEAAAAVDHAGTADVAVAQAMEIRARRHAHAAAMRYRNMRTHKTLDTPTV